MIWLLLSLGCKTESKCSISSEARTYDAFLSWSDTSVDSIEIVMDGETRELNVSDTELSLSSLPSLTPIEAILYSGDELRCSTEFETANHAPELPTFSLGETDGLPTWLGIAGTTMGDTPAVMMLDNMGRFRWGAAVDEDRSVSDVHVYNDVLWHNSASSDTHIPDGRLIQKNWIDMSDDDLLETPFGHHVFAFLPNGSKVQLEVDIRDWYNPQTQIVEQVAGDRLVEIAVDGTQRELFSLWDHIDPVMSSHWQSNFYGQSKDWSHGNGLFYSEDRNSFLISFGHLDQIYEIDADSGEVLMTIGSNSWITDMPFHFPHSPMWLENGNLLVYSLFDASGTAIEYTVHEDQERLEMIWAHSKELPTSFLGQVFRLESGNSLINYGGSGIIQEVNPSGDLIWEAETSLGTWFGNLEVLNEWPKWDY